jgi:hypothetical protein
LRTRVVQVLLALALVGSLTAAYLTSRGLDVRQGGFLPVGSTGIIVLDVSTSISDDSNRQIASVLRDAVRSDQPAGFVMFSDSAYELIPPGTRGLELAPLLRFFTPVQLSRAARRRMGRPGEAAGHGVFRANPWTDTFRGGTRISSGLELGREILLRDHVRTGSVLLISDLDFSPLDFAELTSILIRYRAEHIRLRIVPLGASPVDRAFFNRLLGESVVVDRNELQGIAGGRVQHHFSGVLPVSLIVLGGLCALFLAANELWCGRLAVPRRRPA